MTEKENDRRLIEAGFSCHQVGGETQRERGSSSALPPLYYLHVWWARRPLTPSRAAVLGSILPADTDPDWFLKELGIERKVLCLEGGEWVLVGKNKNLIRVGDGGVEMLVFDEPAAAAFDKENERRAACRQIIETLKKGDPDLAKDPVLLRWERETQPLERPASNALLDVGTVAADPAHVKERIVFKTDSRVKKALGMDLNWTPEDMYGYDRAFTTPPKTSHPDVSVMDITAGGGSIPFEALRLGCRTLANELNPVASVILDATLNYPARFGSELVKDIETWGKTLLKNLDDKISHLFPESKIPPEEMQRLKDHMSRCDTSITDFDQESIMDYIYARQVTCPHCGGEAPLLNTCWLSKADGEPWGVAVLPDGKRKNGTVRFKTYCVTTGKGSNGEDPDFSTVRGGKGLCVHCGQGIDAEEIKRQARGESEHGKWKDRLYAVAAVRHQPKLDKNGCVQRVKTGKRAGEIKMEKVHFFRPPNERDLAALYEAERILKENWTRWEDAGLIPTEKVPKGYNTKQPLSFGMTRWCDLFTPRQLLGHLFLIEELNRLKPQILKELGHEKGNAVVTYLQFAIDKGLDYNSRQTRWECTRGIVKGAFGCHDFSPKWTFGEMVFAGPNSGAAWGLSQILDAYGGIAELLEPVRRATRGKPPLTLLNGTAAAMPQVSDKSVDVICFDPPYYNNVQYAELSDYFYVWQKRTLKDLYPDLFCRRLTNKDEEAVANPDRDGGEKGAKAAYERMMGEILLEARRILKDDGIMTMMFNHKSQEAWETLTQALIEKGWVITSSMPVESETEQGLHAKGTASAISSIFITCRKSVRQENHPPSSWRGFGGSGVQQKVQAGVEKGLEEFASLNLNPVDRMVACYGRALQVLSENWPVLDGDDPVGPKRAMLEASRVVAEAQFREIAKGQLSLSDLSPEAAMAVLLFGIFGIEEFDYDDALSLSRSLNIALEIKTGGYAANGRFIGINAQESGRRAAALKSNEVGFAAPLVRKGSKLRLALPEERDPRRLESPQTEWDLLQGTIMAYREGMEITAKGYLQNKAGEKASVAKSLLCVWAEEVADETLRKEARAIRFGLGLLEA